MACGDLRLSAVWSAAVCGFQTYRCVADTGAGRHCVNRSCRYLLTVFCCYFSRLSLPSDICTRNTRTFASFTNSHVGFPVHFLVRTLRRMNLAADTSRELMSRATPSDLGWPWRYVQGRWDQVDDQEGSLKCVCAAHIVYVCLYFDVGISLHKAPSLTLSPRRVYSILFPRRLIDRWLIIRPWFHVKIKLF